MHQQTHESSSELDPDKRVRTRVLIIDDHPVFRHDLKRMIALDPQMDVVGEAGDGETALALAGSLAPDAAVVDLDLPGMGGLELIAYLRALPRPPAILVLTMHREEQMVDAALDRGARGYLTKESAAAELINGIRAVLRGGIFVSPDLPGAVVRSDAARRLRSMGVGSRSANRSQNGVPVPPRSSTGCPGEHTTNLVRLTPSELRVLKSLSASQNTRQIARHLFISPRIVEIHRASICAKLGLRGTRALVQFAIEHRDEL